MAYGKSIELFLANGTAESLITAELSNKDFISRSMVALATKKISELSNNMQEDPEELKKKLILSLMK
ncbi:hypothetical protein [Dielma fastidiosa]|uniref:Uncharacterized protein n=1 Tax=Dielma fastidiosa TaxID=1034346 RepID=A0AB35UN58_9FIRM|nr:hypothetical protein [Dielma fastidiosa]MDY5168212.1 hypothetical protein [Dielma fastidiosa]